MLKQAYVWMADFSYLHLSKVTQIQLTRLTRGFIERETIFIIVQFIPSKKVHQPMMIFSAGWKTRMVDCTMQCFPFKNFSIARNRIFNGLPLEVVFE